MASMNYFHLLYADDLLLISESPTGHQVYVEFDQISCQVNTQ